MPVLNSIAAFADDMRSWRQALHRHPETAFDLPWTSAFVAERLREFGVDELHEGIARTGMVALIHGRAPGPTIGLRADMDALPMQEATGAPHASEVPGRMHACGHDGHTTMLLGAARYLCETRNFAGTAALIFQPAEESGGGARVMCDEGIIERFSIREAYALHNVPGLLVGQFQTVPGPITAAADGFTITVTGRGGHAAMPHDTRDPIVAACAIVSAIQAVGSRDRDPLAAAVVAVTQVHAGTADNITPETAWLDGTVRTFDRALQATVRRRLHEVAAGTAAAFGVTASFDYQEGYPPTVNDPARAAFAADVAAEVAGSVDAEARPTMGGEDFAYLLERVPGAYLFVGNGDSAGLHHSTYDFNDEAAPAGASFFARLIERALPLEESRAA